MLQFIVLGQIPGTHIQITFRGVLLLIVLGLAALEINTLLRRYRQKQLGTNSSQTAS